MLLQGSSCYAILMRYAASKAFPGSRLFSHSLSFSSPANPSLSHLPYQGSMQTKGACFFRRGPKAHKGRVKRQGQIFSSLRVHKRDAARPVRFPGSAHPRQKVFFDWKKSVLQLICNFLVRGKSVLPEYPVDKVSHLFALSVPDAQAVVRLFFPHARRGQQKAGCPPMEKITCHCLRYL